MTEQEPLRLSPSQMSTFLRCRRSWSLSYQRRLQAAPKVGAASFGTAMHALLAGQYGGPPADLDASYAAARKANPERALELLGERKGAIASVASAKAELATLDAGITVVDTEMELDVPVGVLPSGRPVHVIGFIDLLYRDAAGRLVVRDWKSKTSLNRLPAPMALNFQLRTYCMAAGATRAEIVLVKRHKGSGRASGPFTAAHVVDYTDRQIAAHRQHVLAIAGQIADPAVAVYPTAGEHCAFMCDFLPVCPTMDANPALAAAVLATDFVPREAPSTSKAA